MQTHPSVPALGPALLKYRISGAFVPVVYAKPTLLVSVDSAIIWILTEICQLYTGIESMRVQVGSGEPAQIFESALLSEEQSRVRTAYSPA